MMPRSRISAFLEPFAVIVCSPGPRHPSNADETGSMKDASGLAACETVLVRYLPWIPKPCHSPQRSCSTSASGHEIEACVGGQLILIFEGLSKVHAVQYHSLHAILGHQRCAEEGCIST